LGTKLLEQSKGKEENKKKGVKLTKENDKTNNQKKCC